MQNEINNLILNFKSSAGITWKPIKDAKDIKIFKNDTYQRNKTFSTLNFKDRNLYPVINTFEQLELSILIEEQKILFNLNYS